jgi:hypothetical protein
MERDDMYQLAVKPVHSAHMRVAETHSIDDNRVEDRLEVKARVADDLSTSEVAASCSSASSRSRVR